MTGTDNVHAGTVSQQGSSEPQFKTTWRDRNFPTGMPRRWWLFRLFDLIARYWPVGASRRGVLVVRMDGIGDMVLFRGSLDHYAGALGVSPKDITVLGCDSWRGIADEVFGGTRVVTINEHAFARRPFYRFKVALMVRRLAPQIVVCDSFFRRPLMADSLVWLSGAPQRIVSLPHISDQVRPEFTHYLGQVTRIIDTGPYPTHEVARHFRFVSELAGRPISPVPTRISWRARRPTFADEGGAYAVLTPGSNEPGRRWPFAGYVDLAHRLKARGMRVAIVGKPDERYDADALAAIADEADIEDFTGRTTLDGLMDLMRHAALVVSNDTGPAHLAIALGAPTAVIIGGGHFASFVPYPDDVRPPHARFLYHRMDCYDCFWRCHKRQDPRESFPCVAAVDGDDLWSACVELLETGSADARDQGT